MSSPRVYLPERAGDFERWMRGEITGEVIKQKKARAIWRVPAGTPGLYVKRFPPSLFRDRAVREARLLEWLAAAGIPCVLAIVDCAPEAKLAQKQPNRAPHKPNEDD